MAAKVSEKTAAKTSPVEEEPPQLEEPSKKNKKDKKNKKNKKNAGKEDGSGKSSSIKIVIIALVLLGAIASVIYFNLFGVRETYLRGVLEQIPIVKNILSPVEGADPLLSMTKEQLIAKVKETTDQLSAKEEELKVVNDKTEVYTKELTRLQDIESQQLKYKKDKEEFDKQVASGDPSAYKNFFEQISPENKEALYNDAVASTQAADDLKKYIATISSMDESAAAKVLEELSRSDIKLAVLIVKSLDSEISGAILAVMETQTAAVIVKQLSPVQP